MKPYYDSGGITLYHADGRDVDLEPASVDLLLTDPPYGQEFRGQGTKTSKANVRGDGARQGMRIARTVIAAVYPALRDDAHGLVFCHWESWPDFYDSLSPVFTVRNALIWWKDRGGMGDTQLEYARDYEIILYGSKMRIGRPILGKRLGAVISGIPPISSADRIHPVEKPVRLLTHLISRHCPPGGVVLDPLRRGGVDAGRRGATRHSRHWRRDRQGLVREDRAATGQHDSVHVSPRAGRTGAGDFRGAKWSHVRIVSTRSQGRGRARRSPRTRSARTRRRNANPKSISPPVRPSRPWRGPAGLPAVGRTCAVQTGSCSRPRAMRRPTTRRTRPPA